ncbi:DUF86 domain-containing protein [Candidatus Saccharibacteria bacterium]|nr:DUF86 domain-containing protein [Candidatus Saccharibacteria bacterium]
MNSKDVYLLENIISFCNGIENTIARFGDDFETFNSDIDYQDACELKVIQIGEIVNSLSDSFKDSHPEVAWRNIIGTRNIITHDYGELDNRKVWDTLKHDIPELKSFCSKIIK